MVLDRRIRSIDAAQRTVEDLKNWVRKREKFPPYGVVLKDKSIGTSATTLTHGLGRKYEGYIIIRSDTQATFNEEANANRQMEISLKASAAATVDIWVF